MTQERCSSGRRPHAWVSGQLARAWGNAEFGSVAPYEEVCLAAEQHDVGMAEWDTCTDVQPGHRPPPLVHRDAAAGTSGALEHRPPAAAAPEPVRGAAHLDARDAAVRHARSRPERARRRRADPGLSGDAAALAGGARRVARGRRGRDRPQQPARVDLGLHVACGVPRVAAVRDRGRPDRVRSGHGLDAPGWRRRARSRSSSRGRSAIRAA